VAGIYIHIPFCKQACYYCDFHFSTSLKKKEALVKALANELWLRKEEFNAQTVETVYFGGGTPSLLSVDELQFLIAAVYDNYTVSDSVEITLEANPDDLNGKRIYELKNTAINRLSIGIQSFFEADLKAMNRAHNAQEAKQCLEEATKYFDNITIDLMYGIPGMSLEKWNQNLQQAFEFNVNHISAYALTVESNTAWDAFVKKGIYPPIDEALARQHFNHLVSETRKHGFVHYEISNFGKPDYFSRHNTAYWQAKWYLGIGPSAHSFTGTERCWNVSNNSKYIEAIQENRLPSTFEKLSVADRYNEYVMTGLRTIWGISLTKVEQDFGVHFKNHLLREAEKFLAAKLLTISNPDGKQQLLITTQKGKFLTDGIASALFYLT